MKFRVGGTQINISVSTFFILPLIIITGCLKEYTAAFISITLHELGHMAAARIYGCKTGIVTIMPVGLSVSISDGRCSRSAYIKIYLAGPAVNLFILMAVVPAAAIFPKAEAFFDVVASINAYLAFFNLMPAIPLDGGRILLELFAGRMGLLAAGRIIRRLTLALGLIVFIAGLLQIVLTRSNFSLTIIGLYIFILWKNSEMESAFMNIRQILYRHARFTKRGIYPVRDLAVVRSTRLDDTLNNLDYDRFHLVYVLDDNFRLLRVFTESEIMDAITEGKITTFGQLLEANG